VAASHHLAARPVIDATPALRAWSRVRLAELARQDPIATQRRQLSRLLHRARLTSFGRAHDFAGIGDVAAYQRRVALSTYEEFAARWWRDRFPRVGGATWPGPIRYFANSSGTTGGPTKRIPVSPAMLAGNRGAALDVLAWHLANHPGSRVLRGRNLILGGSTALERLAPGIRAGDLSGIAAAEVPPWAQPFTAPPAALALLPDWREKMARIAPLSLTQRITGLSGTPSWMLLFFEMAAALRPGARLAQLYPQLELVIHGGVGFAPYRAPFAHWLEGSAAGTREVYAASEGFIAIADRGDDEGLRLVLDRGLFFEFVRPADLAAGNPDRRWIADAELGVEYALVVSSNAGLWSYVIGDTVTLIERRPARLRVTGRTAWSLSVAGEHLIGAELDAAMAAAAAQLGRRVADYAAVAVPPDARDSRGGHLFAVELDAPADAPAFGRALDAALAAANADYAAHRAGGFGLRPPELRLLPPGSFTRWMAARGKLGGQNKVPRVVADAALMAALLAEGLP